ncbi:MAG: bifunctional 4-hydroxy-2-oxoglutarate aldolase/2-dehydro-3-deoxy-phosphogluconate aldolase [Sphaerochaeta sp.]|nr:bifunctional 4-hydroxy-2-oxoglutarate aldolase/2-dehydro-3-deoxy-phosphogluconate aldolase [Sphaerochaeta sp.]MDX9914932.1 bifunctional 4-hydroxy-2-oxoglutarate aldolase/2-dehydro-3-deoxy-phosphogluconate aldolase [Sphaerochaeta sp.]
MHDTLFSQFQQIGIVPVVKIDDASKAEGLAQAMLDGGLPCAEITFRTDAAEEAIGRVTKAFPQMLVGAGTVTTVEFAKQAVAAGAQFIVSPGFNPTVVDWCIENSIPIVPGVCTPSDIEAGLSRGLSTLKFFPAEASGGVNMLKNFAGPFPNLTFMPTGGISLANITEYAKQANVLAVGGSWMVKSDLIEAEDWPAITKLCSDAVSAIQGLEFAHVGINNESKEKAEKTIALLQSLGMVRRDGNSSTFLDTTIEVMPIVFHGAMGHLGFRCISVERTIAYLATRGLTVNEKTVVKDAKGRIKSCYFNEDASGFAVHLVRA